MYGTTSVQLKRLCVCCMLLAMTAALSAAPMNGNGMDGTNWWENTDISFDLWLRQNSASIDKNIYSTSLSSSAIPSSNAGTRYNSEYRARVNFYSQVKENVSATVRIASGYQSPSIPVTSTSMPVTTRFQNMDTVFSAKPVWLDLAFVNWQPSQCEGVDIFAGKMPNIFKRAGDNQVIFDRDITPEGAAFNYSRPLDDATTLVGNVGVLRVNEAWTAAVSPTPDVTLFAGQLMLERMCDETSKCLAGVSFYSYTGIEGQTGAGLGNSQVGGLQNDFDLLELFAECEREISGMPCMLFGTLINNTGANSGFNDVAWSFGGRINKAKNDSPGSWELGYDYRDIEEDAVLAGLTDNYFGFGAIGFSPAGTPAGTGSSGHNLTGAYQVAKNIQLAGRILFGQFETTAADYDFSLFQVDLRVKTP